MHVRVCMCMYVHACEERETLEYSMPCPFIPNAATTTGGMRRHGFSNQLQQKTHTHTLQGEAGGEGKMSASADSSAIFLTDSPDQVKKKVRARAHARAHALNRTSLHACARTCTLFLAFCSRLLPHACVLCFSRRRLLPRSRSRRIHTHTHTHARARAHTHTHISRGVGAASVIHTHTLHTHTHTHTHSHTHTHT
jgi:hypothetical protein